MPRLKWPDIIGTRLHDGMLCVGSKPSRSKESNRRYVFRDLETGAERIILPLRIPWADKGANTAILAEALRDVLNEKVEDPFDRGTVAMRVIESTLYLMEAGYRDTLRPCYWWVLPYNMGYKDALMYAIVQEMMSPDKLVARPDYRAPVALENHPALSINYRMALRALEGTELPVLTPVDRKEECSLWRARFVITGTDPVELEPLRRPAGGLMTQLTFVVDTQKHTHDDRGPFRQEMEAIPHFFRYVDSRYQCYWVPMALQQKLMEPYPHFLWDKLRTK